MIEYINKIRVYNEGLLREYGSTGQRRAADKIDWNERLVGIWGPKGVGKTTLLMSKLRERTADVPSSAVYISLDHPIFASLPVVEFAEAFYKSGGRYLLLDEVHKYPGWSTHLKSIYDSYRGLSVVYSGSSALHINEGGADLSRRAALYKLPILSLREFISIKSGLDFEVYSLTDILDRHVEISDGVVGKVRPLDLFAEYLKNGAYPFFQEGLSSYHNKLVRVVNETLESDLVFVRNLDARYASKLRGLLRIVAEAVPFTPKVTDIAQAIEVSRPTVSQYLEYLESGGLISLVRGTGRGYQKLSKPEKLYLDNSNLAYALGTTIDSGTIRETFFVSQLREAGLLVEAAQKADFLVAEKYTFEVGGRNKRRHQLKDSANAYVVVDGVEVGGTGKIPLWLFGFLY